MCHEAARRTAGSVSGSASAGVTPNFHTVVFAYSDRQLAVLRHSTVPMVALAGHAQAKEMLPSFVNDAPLAPSSPTWQRWNAVRSRTGNLTPWVSCSSTTGTEWQVLGQHVGIPVIVRGTGQPTSSGS
jgi:hypothetical protein